MIGQIATFLALYPPFSGLPGHLPGEAARLAALKHLPQGESLGSPASGSKDAEVFVVKSGRLDLYSDAAKFAVLLPGDMFGFAAYAPGVNLEAHRAVAATDSVLVALPAEVFAALAADAAFSERLAAEAARLAEAQQAALRARETSRADPFMRLTIADVELRTPVVVPDDAPLAEAARRMIQAGQSACLVTRGDGVSGILTERDVMGAVAAKGPDPRDIPAARTLTPKIITIGLDQPLFEAFTMMVKHSIRRLVVVDAKGAPRGIVGERDLLAVRGESPVHLAREIGEARGVPALAQAYAKLRSLALRSVAGGADVTTVGRLISEMHDQIITQAARIVAGEMGEPPAPYAVVVLGSEGRREQYFATDQDNAMILSDGQDAAGIETASRFAARFIAVLVETGLPPCKSKVMADNPQWRRTLRDFQNHIEDLVLSASSEAVLTLSLLADMRAVAGDEELCARLRAFLASRIKASPVVLKYMAREAVRFSPPLGFFGNFALEKSGECKGMVDIKKGGIFPVVQGLRVLALDHGVAETSTLWRLARLRDQAVVSEALSARLKEAYSFMLGLRAEAQAEASRRGEAADNCIDPAVLGAGARDRLKDAFRAVAELQTLLHGKYALHLML